MVPNIEKDYILLLGIVFYIRDISLLGSNTEETLLIWPIKEHVGTPGVLDSKGSMKLNCGSSYA